MTSEQNSWRAMISRCTNPKDVKYHLYGGRGITVCQSWLSFAAFLGDLGLKPNPSYTIERVNGNDGYYPGNCKWATKAEQNRNKSNNRLITLNDITKPLMDWCNDRAINFNTARWRLDAIGLPPSQALDPTLQFGPHVSGEDHWCAKLTLEIAEVIREAHRSGDTILGLAKKHGVDRKTIKCIIKGVTWKRKETECQST